MMAVVEYGRTEGTQLHRMTFEDYETAHRFADTMTQHPEVWAIVIYEDVPKYALPTFPWTGPDMAL